MGFAEPQTAAKISVDINVWCAGDERRGACCNDGAGTCVDGIRELSCDGRWVVEATCASDPFDPPCCTNACCASDADCTPCEICEGNACVPVQCGDCERCNNNHRCEPDPPTCGDRTCECGETQSSCREDCGCDACEWCDAGTCRPSCGNGVCESECGEDCKTCPQDCSDGYVTLIEAAPGCDECLWRAANNLTWLTFDDPITQPGCGDIAIMGLWPRGEFGPDLCGSFNFSVEGPGNNMLRITERGSVLTHRTSQGIINAGAWNGVCPFEVDNLLQIGDANGDCVVLFGDLAATNTCIPMLNAPEKSRCDINGDGQVLFSDLSAANTSIPSLWIPKPDCHDCNP